MQKAHRNLMYIPVLKRNRQQNKLFLPQIDNIGMTC